MRPVCIHPWADMCIRANGTVTCCAQNHTVVGDLQHDDFAALWQSASARTVRRLVADAQYEKAGCEKECPFLRGSFVSPDALPPQAELINPAFTDADDDTEYAHNYHKVYNDYRHRREEVHSYPLFVDIQPVLRCNSDCIMCGQPHASPLEHSEELTKKIEFLKPFANYFRWQGGEVFLKNGFFEYLVAFDDCAAPHVRRYVITNGSRLTADWASRLTAGANPVHFLLSIDGASKKTYREVRKKQHYQKAMAALECLADIQHKKGRMDIVRWNYVVMRSTLSDMKDAIDKADVLGVNLNFAPIQGNYPDENIFCFKRAADKNLSAFFKNLDAYANSKNIQVSGFAGIQFRLRNHFSGQIL